MLLTASLLTHLPHCSFLASQGPVEELAASHGAEERTHTRFLDADQTGMKGITLCLERNWHPTWDRGRMTEQGQMCGHSDLAPTCKAHTCISALSLYRRSFQTHLVLQYTDPEFSTVGNTGIGPVPWAEVVGAEGHGAGWTKGRKKKNQKPLIPGDGEAGLLVHAWN